LGLVGGELVEVSTVRRHLFASSGRPIEWIEREHDVLLVPEVAQADFVPAIAGDRRQFKIRSLNSNF
jgi:hypothetical protein